MRAARSETHVHRWTLHAIILLSTMAAGVWLGVAHAGAHDVRLDDAFAALQKAAALVEASSTGGGVSQRTQHRFDRHIENALANIEDAMNHVLAAAAAADADGGS